VLGLRSNGQRGLGRETSPAGRNSGDGALVVNGSGVEGVPRGIAGLDGMQKHTENSRIWSARSGSTCGVAEGRLETRRPSMTFGCRRRGRFTAILDEPNESERAAERERGRGKA
jgi:hypothetical protein